MRTKLQARLQPLGVQATRTERNLGNDLAPGKRVPQRCDGRGWRSPKGGSGKSTANRRCHGGGGWHRLGMPQCQKRTTTERRSVLVADGVVLGETHAWQSATVVLMMAGNELDPVFDSLAPRDRPHACVGGRLDAAGHCGKMRQDGAARAARQRAALGQPSKARLGQLWQPSHACSGRSSSTIRSCGACTMAASLTREEAARTARELCSRRRREHGNGGAWRCVRVMKASAVELS